MVPQPAQDVQLAAADGTPLHGAHFAPERASGVGILLTHGAQSDHRNHVASWLGPSAAARGHRMLSLDRRDRREERPDITFEDGFEDLRVGLDWLHAQGCHRLVLCGHSKGTLYPLAYLQDQADPRVVAVGLLASMSDNHESARSAIMGKHYAHNQELARRERHSGDPIAMETRFGQPVHMTGEAFFSFFGPETLAVPREQIRGTDLPVALLWSESDVLIAPESQQHAIVHAGQQAGRDVAFLRVRDADPSRSPFEAHDFHGVEGQAAAQLLDWLDGVLSAARG